MQDLKNKSNRELLSILRWCSDADLKNAAWLQLKEQAPTNDQLVYILRWCSDADLKNAAWLQLKEQMNLQNAIPENELMEIIAERVLEQPSNLNMSSWHCGTTHCLAGWVPVLHKPAIAFEEKFGTEVTGAAYLPNHAKYFYGHSNEEVLEMLRGIDNTKRERLAKKQ